MNKPVLHLNLISKYYDMIYNGEKPEEYREIKPFYDRIFDEYGYIKIGGKSYHCTEVVVCFSNGYRKDRPQMFWTLKHLEKATGKPQWGAVENKEYYVLHLDKQLEIKHK